MKKAKKILMVLGAAALLFALLQESAYAEERKVTFKVDGVTCFSIVYTVEAIPTRLAGVQSSKYDFAEDGLSVVFDDSQVSMEEIMNALAEENFPVLGEPIVIK
jgi:copper chaperone CopZ